MVRLVELAGSWCAPEEPPGRHGRVIAKFTRGDQPGEAVGYLFSPGRHTEHDERHVVASAAALGVSDGLRPTEAELKELEAAMEAPGALYGTAVLRAGAGTWRCRRRSAWYGLEGHRVGCAGQVEPHQSSGVGMDRVQSVEGPSLPH